MEFATLEEDALLLYNKPGSRDTDEFIALELVQGSVRFSFALGAGNVSRITVPTGVANGRWHRVIAERDGKVAQTFITVRIRNLWEGDCQGKQLLLARGSLAGKIQMHGRYLRQ